MFLLQVSRDRSFHSLGETTPHWTKYVQLNPGIKKQSVGFEQLIITAQGNVCIPSCVLMVVVG